MAANPERTRMMVLAGLLVVLLVVALRARGVS